MLAQTALCIFGTQKIVCRWARFHPILYVFCKPLRKICHHLDNNISRTLNGWSSNNAENRARSNCNSDHFQKWRESRGEATTGGWMNTQSHHTGALFHTKFSPNCLHLGRLCFEIFRLFLLISN